MSRVSKDVPRHKGPYSPDSNRHLEQTGTYRTVAAITMVAPTGCCHPPTPAKVGVAGPGDKSSGSSMTFGRNRSLARRPGGCHF